MTIPPNSRFLFIHSSLPTMGALYLIYNSQLLLIYLITTKDYAEDFVSRKSGTLKEVSIYDNFDNFK